MIALLGIVAFIGLLGWWLRRNERTAHRRQARREEIDWRELEEAEREVRDWGIDVRPDDDVPGADWGPGTGKPRGPELL